LQALPLALFPKPSKSRPESIEEKNMKNPELRINASRLEKDLCELGTFGETAEGGIRREALSEADLSARAWLKKRLGEAGMAVREDEAANLIGRWAPESAPAEAPAIAFGSHSDAVPDGGKFDGALGICAGLEAFRALRESGIPLPCPLELLVFTDEEGSHFAGTFGSRAMLGLLAEGEIYKSKGAGEPTLAAALRRAGRNPEKIGSAARSPAEFRAFLELHIEQGPVLESLGVPIGIVEGIVFIERHILRVSGRPGHAGTTPMHLRDDALVKAARIILAVHDAILGGGPDVVGTIGKVEVHPGAFNIIPGRADLLLELRSLQEPVLAAVRDAIGEIVRSRRGAEMRLLISKGGVHLDEKIGRVLEAACREKGVESRRMGSGAGHDAMTFQARGIPTGMIFIPCKEGKSHCPEESIRMEDAVTGTRILAETVLRLAGGEISGEGP
jgi:beta-ureidopropionase / N-carbamoyl-L-amino-acid hydrolase